MSCVARKYVSLVGLTVPLMNFSWECTAPRSIGTGSSGCIELNINVCPPFAVNAMACFAMAGIAVVLKTASAPRPSVASLTILIGSFALGQEQNLHQVLALVVAGFHRARSPTPAPLQLQHHHMQQPHDAAANNQSILSKLHMRAINTVNDASQWFRESHIKERCCLRIFKQIG